MAQALRDIPQPANRLPRMLHGRRENIRGIWQGYGKSACGSTVRMATSDDAAFPRRTDKKSRSR